MPRCIEFYQAWHADQSVGQLTLLLHHLLRAEPDDVLMLDLEEIF